MGRFLRNFEGSKLRQFLIKKQCIWQFLRSVRVGSHQFAIIANCMDMYYLAKIANISHWYLCGENRELLRKSTVPHVLYVARIANQFATLATYIGLARIAKQFAILATQVGVARIANIFFQHICTLSLFHKPKEG